MASLKITVQLMNGEVLCSIEAEPHWTVAHLESEILTSLPAGRFLKGLLLVSQELERPDHRLEELGFVSECENVLSAILQQGVPPGTYEGEAYGFGWSLEVSAGSKFAFQKSKGDLKGAKVQGRMEGDLLFLPCPIEDALGVKISCSKWSGHVFSPSPYFYAAAMFPEAGKMILKSQVASAVIRGGVPPTMPLHMGEEEDFEVVTYFLVGTESRADEVEAEEEAEEEKAVEVADS